MLTVSAFLSAGSDCSGKGVVDETVEGDCIGVRAVTRTSCRVLSVLARDARVTSEHRQRLPVPLRRGIRPARPRSRPRPVLQWQASEACLTPLNGARPT